MKWSDGRFHRAQKPADLGGDVFWPLLAPQPMQKTIAADCYTLKKIVSYVSAGASQWRFSAPALIAATT